MYNEKKGYCDYPENCSSGHSPVAPQPSPLPQQPVHPPAHSQPLDCTGRPDGHYSNGCSSDFVFCSDGVATMMVGIAFVEFLEIVHNNVNFQECPSALVFNEKMGYCDYPESCSSGAASPVPVPSQAQHAAPSTYS